MLLTCAFAILAGALFYRNRRNKELISETLLYYERLSNKLSTEIRQQRELASLLAHDLKSPLAGVISSAKALELAGNKMPAPFLECLRLMQSTGRANLRLLSNFLEFINKSAQRTTVSQIPQNRLEMLERFIEPALIDHKKLVWVASPWLLKTQLPLHVLAGALAEIFSAVCSIRRETLTVEEAFEPDSKNLRLTFQGLPADDEMHAHRLNPYVLALELLSKLDLELTTTSDSDRGTVIEIKLPITECLPVGENPSVQREMRADAELLLQIAVREVDSASRSLQEFIEGREESPANDRSDQSSVESGTDAADSR